jgi:hypothetical protein
MSEPLRGLSPKRSTHSEGGLDSKARDLTAALRAASSCDEEEAGDEEEGELELSRAKVLTIGSVRRRWC